MWLVAEEAAYEADMDLLLEMVSITELFHESLFTKLQKRKRKISWFYLVCRFTHWKTFFDLFSGKHSTYINNLFA